jgi:hypothetical protein
MHGVNHIKCKNHIIYRAERLYVNAFSMNLSKYRESMLQKLEKIYLWIYF